MGKPFKFLKTEKGQISIMVGAMMMTFLFFFAFVINVGMLVNAKINLQNAADLAAFAGASVQARQLTRISYLNYEMRRQWKKYLFRIFVIGNMAQDGFPKGPMEGQMVYQPNKGDPSVTFPAPSTCIIFSKNNNVCHVTKLPKIESNFNNPVGEGITEALKAQLKKLEQIRENNCKAIGITNQILNILWTFNTDPAVLSFTQSDSGINEFLRDASTAIKAYAKGLGVVPRELILKFRINTLAGYVNSPAIKGLTLGKANQLSSNSDPAAVERSIQAFFSAYYTLGNHTFPSGSIVMDELLPGDTTQANLLRLNPIGAAFDIYAVDLDIPAAGGDCQAKLYATSITNPLTLGFYKDETIQTYYAIRLKAKARLLFSPFGDLDLTAYAAARPFGSRIGPPDSEVGFTTKSNVPNAPTQRFPNLTVKENEGGSLTNGVPQGSGWDTKAVIGTMYAAMTSGSSNSGGTVQLQPHSMERAYSTAMAPNPWESGRYNIFNSTQDSFQGDFATGTSTEGGFAMKYMTFWAPIVPPDKIGQLRDLLKTELDVLFNTSNTQGSIRDANNGTPLNGLKGQILVQLERYIASLQPSQAAAANSASGENGETTNMVVLTDPFMRLEAPNALQQISSSPLFMSTEPNQLKTSWKWAKYSALQREGRDGYSVKFVSFSSLGKNKTGSWTNDIRSVGDPEISKDLQSIQH